MKNDKLKVIFNSIPVEFKQSSVVLEVNGETQEIPNDFAWIFAGGEPPTAFLKKIGVRVGLRDMTAEGSSEAKKSAPVQMQA
jgi:thioredoxin reductase (NADPH)